ncbi:MAG TPA: hypothetical protein DD706_05570, partial [Nitrospiraceae bacterium]|nr:hypothetical protein [Nitrospiraceae bacterium]
MSNNIDQLSSPDPGAPVFRPGAFKGREGLVRNMLRRLERGESLSLVGGPKLGKTSMLLHLALQLNHERPSSKSTGPSAVYVDIADEADWKRFHSRPPNPDTILLFDNCDRLVEGKTRSLSDIDLLPGGSMVFAGARAWREVVRGGDLPHTLKLIPLSVFLEKEAQQLFSPDLSTEQQATVLTNAGTHPYIFKLLQAELLRGRNHVQPEQVVKGVKNSLSSFFHDCLNQLREPLENQVLAYV